MSIPVACKCGQQFMAQPHLAGKQVACPSCGSPLVIPATDAKPAASESDPVENVVSCQCGQSFKAAPHLFGKQVSCPSCGQPIDIPGEQNRANSMSKPAATAQSLADGTSETDADMEWDDAWAMPASAAPLDALGTGPAYAMRRTTPEPIEPMTMYAIWIGGGAVALLILVILGHIIWNAFADSDGREGPADQPTESAPIEPGGSGEPGEGSASETESPEAMVTIDE